MTWEELCEKAKEMEYEVVIKYPYGESQECLTDGTYGFYKDGTVECECDFDEFCGRPFIQNRTLSQMYQIMEAFE